MINDGVRRLCERCHQEMGPVHQDQLWAQCSVTSMGSLYFVIIIIIIIYTFV